MYDHQITIAAREADWPDANQLALTVGDQPTDDQTFTRQNAIDADGGAWIVVTFLTDAERAGMLTGRAPLAAPDHAPWVDLNAAARALDAVTIREGSAIDDVMGELGLEAYTPPPVPPVPETISAMQAMIVVGEEKWREAMSVAEDPTFPWGMRAAILRGTELKRHSETVDSLGWILNMDENDIDNLFRAAAKVEL